MLWSARRRPESRAARRPAPPPPGPRAPAGRPQRSRLPEITPRPSGAALRPQIARYHPRRPAGQASAPRAPRDTRTPRRRSPTLFSCHRDRRRHSQLNKTGEWGLGKGIMRVERWGQGLGNPGRPSCLGEGHRDLQRQAGSGSLWVRVCQVAHCPLSWSPQARPSPWGRSMGSHRPPGFRGPHCPQPAGLLRSRGPQSALAAHPAC